MANTILRMLAGGDRRSIRQANRVAALASADRAVFRLLIEALWHDDRLVRMRAADALEKASAAHKQWLQPFKKALLSLLDEASDRELRWHLAQIVPRLELSPHERRGAAASLQTYLEDSSSIVRTFAMQALADLAEQDESLRPEVVDLVRFSVRTGTPAMRARGRALLARLDTDV